MQLNLAEEEAPEKDEEDEDEVDELEEQRAEFTVSYDEHGELVGSLGVAAGVDFVPRKKNKKKKKKGKSANKSDEADAGASVDVGVPVLIADSCSLIRAA